jgi:hypothetical protein
MAPKLLGTSGFTFALAAAAAAVFLGWGVEVVEGVTWITKDAKGRRAIFEVPNDHPALKATGKKAEAWTRTEFFLDFERRLAANLRGSRLDKEQGVDGADAADERADDVTGSVTEVAGVTPEDDLPLCTAEKPSPTYTPTTTTTTTTTT